jgi:hypothetical protein
MKLVSDFFNKDGGGNVPELRDGMIYSTVPERVITCCAVLSAMPAVSLQNDSGPGLQKQIP